MRQVLYSLVFISVILLLPSCGSCGRGGQDLDPANNGGTANNGSKSNDKEGVQVASANAPHHMPSTASSPAINNTPRKVRTMAQTGPLTDEADIVTTTDVSGVKTVTRTFKNDPDIAKIEVITPPTGKQTVKVYSCKGETMELPDYMAESALSDSGGDLAKAADLSSPRDEIIRNERRAKAADLSSPRDAIIPYERRAKAATRRRVTLP